MKTPCDIRPGRASDGRPVVGNTYLYRILYEERHGPLAAGTILHHECENPSCVNPEHLTPMTQSEHAKAHGWGGDKEAGQAQKTHCPQGHAYDNENTYHYRGERHCKTCRVAAKARYRAARRGM